MATKVTGEKMTEAERKGLKTWYCCTCGGELDEQLNLDPTGRVKCSACGTSWWAALPPSAADVDERMAAIEAEKQRAAAAHEAARR